MTKSDKRIEELEKRVRMLEDRILIQEAKTAWPMYPIYPVPYPVYPLQPSYPFWTATVTFGENTTSDPIRLDTNIPFISTSRIQ